MKIFIVFTAFLLVFSMLLVYGADVNGYMLLQKHLKALAEDCAEAGALTIDPASAVIDRNKADEAAADILTESKMFKDGSVTVRDSAVTKSGRGYSVTLRLDCGELFRLDFLSKKSIERTSEYAWE